MGNSSSHTHQPLERGVVRGPNGELTNTKSASFRFSKRSPKKMDRLRRSFRDSFRRRKDRVPESSKPHQWQADEQSVRSATCSFPVKYLGCVEVFESRGMQVCEEALKVLRSSRRRAIRGLLHVSGDGLRVVDDDTKGLIVDQTIEKVSFCAPDRNLERGFSYICRDGTTRRWMCHGFLASKDSGERLSHAVGCAFAVCLERKQRRDKECNVTMTFDMKNSTFTRSGSFRTQSITERLANADTPSAMVAPNTTITTAASAGAKPPHNPFAIERPHATPSMLERQGSFRAFNALGSQSPFKRQMSLRINDLPSNAERQKAFLDPIANGQIRSVSPIPEISPQQTDTVSQLCQELSQGLSLLTRTDTDDLNFNNLTSINQNTAATLLGSPISLTSPTYAGSTTMTILSSALRTTQTISSTVMSISSAASTTSQPIRLPSAHINTSTIPTAQISPRYRDTIATVSPITSPIKSSPGDSPQLPAPDQWLGQIAKHSSSPIAATVPVTATAVTTASAAAPLQRAAPPMLSARTKSLNNSVTSDPFDADWATKVTGKPEMHPNNPFISPPKPPAQSFQVQL